MPIITDLSNLVIAKDTIDKKVKGGVEQFRKDWIDNYKRNEEDDELFSLSKMNPDEFDIDALISQGLAYDIKSQSSEDFVIVTKYGHKLWIADWLEVEGSYMFHRTCPQAQKDRAKYYMNEITMDRVEKEALEEEREYMYPIINSANT
tara:strand:- start:286 stop:729 length:444 start_codon:yes stop_codon:yes gene_type:complete